MAGPVFLGKNIAAEHRRDAEYRDEAGIHAHAVQGFGRRLGIAGEVENRVGGNAQRADGGCSSGEFLDIVPDYPVSVRLLLHLRELAAELDEFFGMRVRERIDDYGFDGGEDDGGGG